MFMSVSAHCVEAFTDCVN